MLEKIEPIRNKKLLAASNGRSCVYCGADDGTIVRAHYTGYRAHAFGKGTGIKGHDLIGADLCATCHADFDQYRIGEGASRSEQRIDHSEQFLFACALTMVRDYEEGILRTPGLDHKPL